MNTIPSKEFWVTIWDCENLSHARKIKKILRDSFPIEGRRNTPSNKRSKAGLAVRVKANSEASIQKAIDPHLRNAKARIMVITNKLAISRQFTSPRKRKAPKAS